MEIAKKPKAQVWGGDLWARDGIKAAISSSSGNLYSSWSEYGAISKEPITSFGSAGSIPLGLAGDSEASCKYSILSFTNQGCPDAIGNYSFNRQLPDIGASFANASSSLSSGDLSSVDSGVYKVVDSAYTLSGGNIALGKQIIIYAPDKDITISGDIKYDNGLISSLSNIPQVLIIAKNINIEEVVRQVDAWLVAEKTVNTCSDISLENIKIGNCEDQLKINGPVIAEDLNLYRTFGNDVDDEPAEIINLRADAYLWAANWASSSSSIKTVYVIEQPPRF